MCVFKYLMYEEMVCHIDCHVGQGDCGVGKGRLLRLQWSFGHHLHHLSDATYEQKKPKKQQRTVWKM